jgi:hypothetical protein
MEAFWGKYFRATDDGGVITFIPADPLNADYQKYLFSL